MDGQAQMEGLNDRQADTQKTDRLTQRHTGR